MILRPLLSLFACALIAPITSAQVNDVPYHSGQFYVAGSALFTGDEVLRSNENTGTGIKAGFPAEFDPEWSGVGAVGYHMAGFRGEIEGGLRELSVDGVFDDIAGIDTNGDIDLTTVMINVYYDQPIIERTLDLYVGMGAGLAIVDADLALTSGGTPITITVDGNPNPVGGVDESVPVAAFQVMAGLALHVHPNVTLTGGYRGFYLDMTEFDNNLFFDDTFFHGAEVGVRITF